MNFVQVALEIEFETDRVRKLDFYMYSIAACASLMYIHDIKHICTRESSRSSTYSVAV